MKIILIRRGKRATMEISDLLLDLQPEAPRYAVAQMYPMIKEFLNDTTVNKNSPPLTPKTKD